jgi:hypothetical protein
MCSCAFHSTRSCVCQRTWTRSDPSNTEATNDYGHVFDVQSSFREPGAATESSKAWSCNAPHCPRIIAMEVPGEGHLVILRLWVLHLQIHIVSHIFGVNSVTNSAKRLARGLGRSQPQTQRRRNRCTFSTLQKCPSTSIGKPLAVLRTADTRFAPNLAITCEFTFEEKS